MSASNMTGKVDKEEFKELRYGVLERYLGDKKFTMIELLGDRSSAFVRPVKMI